ncbi:hypothetical protein CASFOL_031495 [Castilleja foliolosa]|uniref:Uncharacterized protein n=1 Tax=Castilleja foliolosa TaxID=1961234 RepID=A0ABD3C7S8_9LAMI
MCAEIKNNYNTGTEIETCIATSPPLKRKPCNNPANAGALTTLADEPPMEDSKSRTQRDVDEEFQDALDDFPLHDCIGNFPEPIESNCDVSISSENPNSSPSEKEIPRPGIRLRRSHLYHKPSAADSSVNSENYLRERKSKLALKIEDCSNEFEKSSAPLEIKRSSEYSETDPNVESDEKSEEHSTVTNTNDNTGKDLARNESNPMEIEDPNSSLLFTLAAFAMGWMLIKVMVKEPIRITRSLNFDYKQKSLVAYVPIMTGPELLHDMYLGGSRVIPANHKLKVTVSLTLPESEYNQNLGIFQVRVDLLGSDGKTQSSSYFNGLCIGNPESGNIIMRFYRRRNANCVFMCGYRTAS